MWNLIVIQQNKRITLKISRCYIPLNVKFTGLNISSCLDLSLLIRIWFFTASYAYIHKIGFKVCSSQLFFSHILNKCSIPYKFHKTYMAMLNTLYCIEIDKNCSLWRDFLSCTKNVTTVGRRRNNFNDDLNYWNMW